MSTDEPIRPVSPERQIVLAFEAGRTIADIAHGFSVPVSTVQGILASDRWRTVSSPRTAEGR